MDTYDGIGRCVQIEVIRWDKFHVVHFDVHAQDIMGILIVGGTLIMLRPEGILDFVYLADVFKIKQITYIQTVPSLLRSFFTFLTETQYLVDVICLRSLCTSGKW